MVRLKGGDAFVFGRGGEEVDALRDAGIAYSVVPGITAGLGAAAQFEVPLTYRREALRITFLTAHKAEDAEQRRLVHADRHQDDGGRLHGHDRGAVGARRPAGGRPLAANAGRRVRAGDAAGCAIRRRHAGAIARRWSPPSTAVPPFSSSATWSRIPRRGASHIPTQTRLATSGSRRMTSPLQQKDQDHRSLHRHRQPHLGRRGDLPHRRAGLVDRTLSRRRDRAHRRRGAGAAGRIRGRRSSARSAPISRRSRSRTAARSSPAICANRSASAGVTIDLPVPA